MQETELLDIVNEDGEIIGVASRGEVHGNNSLLHRVVHVLVFDAAGDLILQKRSMNKDVAPGKWDTSVGGHVDHGETVEAALVREMREELGIISASLLTVAGPNTPPELMYCYIHSNSYESELVHTYRYTHTGAIDFNSDEIDEVRGWPLQEVCENLGRAIFSDNFEDEFRKYLDFKDSIA
ncbi:MAG: NUDIX domain-containing protein [Candidatus Magnetobacterium sp. LHC-1]|uniref:NUDIX domain-containing protein n=1 Tax=Candidatus Magnetobacterium casense TaxID=1455061 RepID=A0ABS6RZT5_9BACT|nr:NUDIX domain-containing protein [Candidatus Magnetobacterium casensis]MBF0608059.1 NUDIX domain-containing protein [Nitrospirota bacterium]MBV6342118.1 NUDIX domain-containing protein [Candidatus Magnetobacterium casensis]